MTRRVGIVMAVTALVAVLGATVPAGAAPAPAGDRINVLVGDPTVYAAGTPFHVLHGWGLDPAVNKPVGRYGFELTLDGESLGRGRAVTERVDDGAGGTNLSKRWLYNFPAGLSAGDHEFVGTWYAPCTAAVADWGHPGPCPQKHAPVPVLTMTLTVTFG